MAPSTKILQWNCRGLKVNFNELKLLCKEHNPLAFALQETHLKESDNITFRSYDMYNTYSPIDENDRAKGGSSIFVKQGIIHGYISLNTKLQAVAVRITAQNHNAMLHLYSSIL